MKTSLKLFLAALIGTLLVSVCLAQDGSTVAPVTALPENIIAWLTPVLVPIILAAFKKFAPQIPSAFIPICAPILGFVIGVLNNVVTTNPGNLWVAAGLGLLGVGLRELKEAFKKAENGGWPVEDKP